MLKVKAVGQRLQKRLGACRCARGAIRDLLDGEYTDIEERTDAGVTIDVGPPGVQMVQQASKSHVLRSPQHPWWILVGDGLATLATSEYSSRRDFVSRVCRLREALAGVGVPAVHWVGVRYVSRVTGADFINDLPTYLQREMLGGTQLPLTLSTRSIEPSTKRTRSRKVLPRTNTNSFVASSPTSS